MPLDPASRPKGIVVAHLPHTGAHASEHERCTLRGFVRQIAALLGFEEGGFFDPAASYPAPLYFVPADTLTADEAAALDIRGPGDLFGGVVPHAFVATKVISHPLVHPQAAATPGWNPELARRLGDAVLAGFSAFTLDDAREAGRRLLARGPVRIKPVRATGGRGQGVAHDAAALDRLLDAVDQPQVHESGLVLEEDLADPVTFSVGQVQVGDLLASYFGVQKLTPDNQGQTVFGGSDLTVARGGYDELAPLAPDADVVRAIAQARHYEETVRACYPGFYASRSNCDVALGRDADGRPRSAVLESSWRAGGATGPELAALEAFRADPRRRCVRASCVEAFGDAPPPPEHATVYFRGHDPQVGLLTKYTVVEEHDHSR